MTFLPPANAQQQMTTLDLALRPIPYDNKIVVTINTVVNHLLAIEILQEYEYVSAAACSSSTPS